MSRVVQARVDDAAVDRAQAALKKMGMSMSELIRLTVFHVGEHQALPFRPSVPHIPNAETIAAMQELEDGGGKSFSSVAELMADLKSDDDKNA